MTTRGAGGFRVLRPLARRGPSARGIASVALAALVVASSLLLAQAVFAGGAAIDLTPNGGKPGRNVGVDGSGFPGSGAAAIPVMVFWDWTGSPQRVDGGSVVSEIDGTFTMSFEVPSAWFGPHVVHACVGTGGTCAPTAPAADATFTVIRPILTLNRTSGVEGTNVTASGRRFFPGRAVRLTWDPQGSAIDLASRPLDGPERTVLGHVHGADVPRAATGSWSARSAALDASHRTRQRRNASRSPSRPRPRRHRPRPRRRPIPHRARHRTPRPTPDPTPQPTQQATARPTRQPTPEPTPERPTPQPTAAPTPTPDGHDHRSPDRFRDPRADRGPDASLDRALLTAANGAAHAASDEIRPPHSRPRRPSLPMTWSRDRPMTGPTRWQDDRVTSDDVSVLTGGLLLSLLIAFLVPFPGTLFNKTVENNYEESTPAGSPGCASVSRRSPASSARSRPACSACWSSLPSAPSSTGS